MEAIFVAATVIVAAASFPIIPQTYVIVKAAIVLAALVH